MAEEAGPALSPPAPLDHHKRKHDELESEEAPESTPANEEPAGDLSLEPDGVRKDVDFTEDQVSDSFDAKRPRLDEKPDGLANENGHEVAEKENAELPEKNAEANEDHENQMAVVEQPPGEESVRDNYTNDEMHVPGNVHERPAAADDSKMEDEQPPSCTDNDQSDNALNPVQDEGLKSDVPQQRDDSAEQYLDSGSQTMSRKIEVPNNKVGVLIGKAGDTIRLLQSNSGAKIQITRDADADPRSSTRPVELVGTLESINKAESLIRDVIAEADAGGSPSLVARGFTTVVPVGDAEQIELQVPNEKVGMIIGKGGETIKSLQTRSGARIQLVPQHLPEGDRSKERTVRVSGDKKQIETARELIKEVMSQPMRPSPLSNNYNQQAYRPRGPAGPPQWGGRGPNTLQPLPYDYQQRGPHPSHNQQFLTSYGAYHSHVTPRGSFGSGWEQRPPMQGPPQSGGYDYYGQGGHMANVPASAPHSSHASGHPSMASSVGPPNSQANYNYGQPRGPDCGQSAPYSQTVAPHQGYGQGFAEPKYENQGPVQQPYGAHLSSQPGSYPDAQVYPPHQHFNRPPAYGMISQGPQSYAPSAAGQVGDASYQAPNASTQPYGQNVAPQPTYPYSSSGIAQAPYGSAPATNDGYNQPPPASGAVPAYQQQAAQPVPGYGQPVAQQVPVYAQTSAPAAAYGQYPSSQPGYSEQSAPAAATYAYQGQTDPAYAGGQAYSAAPTGQQGYAQPAPAQASYDQSAQSGSYAGNPPVGALGYGKSLSPQPQPGYPPYDSSQMYGAGR